MERKVMNTKVLVICAACLSIAFVLSYLRLFKLPYGGSVTVCSMFFVSLIGYLFGVIPGIIGAVSYGLLQLIIDPYIVHPVQVLFDYILAFGFLGISGFFSSRKYGLYVGYCLGVLGRFVCGFLSGVIFFSAFAPEGMNPVWYSFIYNGSYLFSEMVLTLIIISIPVFHKTLERFRLSYQ